MSYPLIILGAGASYDYIDLSQYRKDVNCRPPLVKDLFSDRFGSFLNKYPDLADLAAHASGIANFEEYLTDVRDVFAKTNKERYKQLIALRFYLCNVFLWISENYYHNINYYRKLITSIKDHEQNAQACFVNFNYDLLLEKNLSDINDCTNIDDYVKGNIKVIKIHGACNWFYNTETLNTGTCIAYNHYIHFAENFILNYLDIERADKNPVIKNAGINWNFQEQSEGKTTVFLPALAIPISKKAQYVCPESHIKHLQRAIELTDKILIIGWKGNDGYLIEELMKIKRKAPVVIVSKTSSEKLKTILSVNEHLEITAFSGGFSEFMVSKEHFKFFGH